ncbi:unnamed protein product [Adineta ricciae]|uniref:Uncharacterized protein n=1 Tax=Adineta ricciae TaxID=249248 RepID=A0A813YSY9_ADIRI|nr:unnamed protein product [Adineta ricciae]
MIIVVVILNLIFYCGSVRGDVTDEIGVDVLRVLKEKKIVCDLHDLVTSVDKPEKEYNMFVHDLTKHCSESVTTDFAPILCRMISIALEIACTLPNTTRPAPVKYTPVYTPSQICSMHKIVYTNKWIWEQLTKKQKAQIGSSWVQLCPKLTSGNSTLRLTRFFYKIAPRIRHIQESNAATPIIRIQNSSISISTIEEKTYALYVNQSVETSPIAREVPKTIPVRQGRRRSIFDSGFKRSRSNKTRKNLGLRKHFLDHYEENLLDFADIQQKTMMKKKKAFRRQAAVNQIRKENAEIKPRSNLDQPDANRRREHQWIDGKRPIDMKAEAWSKYDEIRSVRHANRKKISLRHRSHRLHDDNDGDYDGSKNSLVTYFLIFIVLVIIMYFILQNKNKIFALIIEGCGRNAHGRRLGSTTHLSHRS